MSETVHRFAIDDVITVAKAGGWNGSADVTVAFPAAHGEVIATVRERDVELVSNGQTCTAPHGAMVSQGPNGIMWYRWEDCDGGECRTVRGAVYWNQAAP